MSRTTKLKLLNTILLSFVFTLAKGDVGEPTIQAVCKVTLSDGKSIEGLITLGHGGDFGLWMNGLYFEHYEQGKYKYEWTEFFTLDTKSFTRKDSSYFFENHSYRDCRRVKYLVCLFSPTYSEPKKLTYDCSGSLDTVRLITHIERKYIALDSMTIFFETTSSTFLDTLDNYHDPHKKIKYQKVAINDIVKFELMTNPSQTWLDLITKANIKAQELFNGPNSSGDFLEAAWYHDIVAKKELYDYFQPRIKFNIER